MKNFFTRFVLPFGLVWVALYFIRLLFHQNLALFLVLAGILSITLINRKSRLKTVTALCALILGTFGEWVCCRVGMWVYVNPTLGGLPLWLPLVWPIIMANFLEICLLLDQGLARLGQGVRVGTAVVLALSIVAYSVFTFLVLKNTVALILFGFMLLVLPFARKPFNAVFFVAVAAGGFFGEYVLVQAGVWHYTAPAMGDIGMPVSLPLAWGLSANMVYLAARGISGGKSKEKEYSGEVSASS